MCPIDALREYADAERAKKMRAYHKTDREVLGVTNPEINALIKEYRGTPEADLKTADALWRSGVFEARTMAGGFLKRGKLSNEMDAAYWEAEQGYAAEFDGWAIADHMAMAAHQRVLRLPKRYLDLKPWTTSAHLWSKRAALVYTLPYARLQTPSAEQNEAIEEILSWAAAYTHDKEWFIQKSVSWWLRERSKRDPKRVVRFLDAHGEAMKPFARKDASKYID